MDVLCMVVSMTGFGRSKIANDSFSVSVEVKTVNHRFQNLIFGCPVNLIKLRIRLKRN